MIRPIVPVRIVNRGNGSSTEVYALLDSGSDRDVISNDVKDALGLSVLSQRMSVKTLDSVIVGNRSTTNFTLQSLDSSYSADVDGALVADMLTSDSDIPPSKRNVSGYPHLADLVFDDLDSSVQMIVGVAHIQAWLGGGIRRGGQYHPLGLKTDFGWTLVGACGRANSSNIVSHAISADNQELSANIDKIFYNDFAVVSEEEIGDSEEHREAIRQLDATFRFDDKLGKYVCGLPWRYGREKTAEILRSVDSKAMAMKRLKSMIPRLRRDEARADRIFAEVSKFDEKGVAMDIVDEELENEKAVEARRPIWHLPLMAVEERGKTRMCHDAKASTGGISINDLLLGGPNLTNSLASILLSFRAKRYVFTTDISAFFHQVYLDEPDIDSFRYLWFSDRSMKSVQMKRFLSHIFGSVASSFVTSYCLRRHAETCQGRFPENVIRTISEEFYVDDGQGGEDELDDAVQLKDNLIAAMKSGGFDLSKWKGNHPKLAQADSSKVKESDILDDTIVKVLGVQWNPRADHFIFSIDLSNLCLPATTPRQLVSVQSSLYDPLGLISPFIMLGRSMLQRSMLDKRGWDSPLPSELRQEFFLWASSIPLLKNYPVPRWWNSPSTVGSEDVSLHLFADASQKAYGAVGYIRIVGVDGSIHVCILSARSHVVPLNPARASHHNSTPRLEVTAMLKSIELRQFIEKALGKFKVVKHWTDTECGLKQLHDRTNPKKAFFANRLSKIHAASSLSEWAYVDSASNPADLCSRGIKADEAEKWHRFYNGPSWLWKSEEHWPVQKDYTQALPIPEVAVAAVETQPQDDATPSYDIIYQAAARVDLWLQRLKRVAIVLKAVEKWKNYRRVGATTRAAARQPRTVPRVSANDVEKAEMHLIRAVQHRFFSLEIQQLKKNRVDTPNSRREMDIKDSSLRALNPFLDADGVIRVGSRLVKADLDYHAKFPAILPRKDQVVRALIRFQHLKDLHAGPKYVLTQLRRTIWVVHGMQEVRSVLSKCVTCQRAFKRPLEQKMAPLPEFRVNPGPPFSEVGLDMMGPFGVKMNGRATHKVWAAVFSCLKTRSVHVELVYKMDADSLVNAIVRFSARRPGSTHFVSDQGTNLTAADKILKREMQIWNESVTDALQRQGLKWSFIPPRTPHRGGSWERLIGLFKRHLGALALGDEVHVDTFNTVLIQIEGILNRRPLTALSPSADDHEPLTPAHILYPAFTSHQSCVPDVATTSSTNTYRSNFAKAQSRVNAFWKAWSRDYLTLLHSRQKWRKTRADLRPGELVLVVDEQMPRSQWKMGRVLEVSSDGEHVRDAKIRTASAKVLWRDRTKLVRLELDQVDEDIQ